MKKRVWKIEMRIYSQGKSNDDDFKYFFHRNCLRATREREAH